jgi:hypothetical protein
MTRALFTLLVPVLLCTPVFAGPNSNGAIIVHTNDAYEWGSSTVCTTPLGQPATCADAVTRTDKSADTVIWFLASFVPTSAPDVMTIYFGINQDEMNVTVDGYGHCGLGLEIPDDGWPSNADGTTWGFYTPETSTLFRFYWFSVSDRSGAPGAYFCSAANPTGGYASFVSSDIIADGIIQFGCVQWYGAGYNTCPQAMASGACCAPDGSCTISVWSDCVAPSGWHGEWTSCEPNNNCPQPIGACCSPEGNCTVTLVANCVAPSTWHPEWSACGANPCALYVTAACCSRDGTCALKGQTYCQPPNVWHLGWASCSPNPCPQPAGACCAPDGACVLRAQADCPAPNAWHSTWASCSPNPCPFPTRACCAPNGVCTIRTQAACQTPNVWHPEWSSCGPTNNCPQPMGACCNPSGSCTVTLAANCAVPSIWHLAFGGCDPNYCVPVVPSPNSNGAIIVHTNDAYDWQSSTVCTTTLGQPATCAEAITTVAISSTQGNVVWFLAAFMPSALPDVKTIYFGIDYDDVNLSIDNYKYCGSGLEIPDSGWPSNDTGDTWGFNTAQTSTLFRFYWFLVGELSSPAPTGADFCSAVNPAGGYASFIASDLSTDRITQFGCVHWYEAGYNTCPEALADGSCCAPDGSCTLTVQIYCVGSNVWHGEWASCQPVNNCPQPTGACCDDIGGCTLTTEAACALPSVWYGTMDCTPDECPPSIPTKNMTWGQVKWLYR